ncbi:hypothetical protein IHE45_04G125800 [Dioscorea alata]|uniref:Uncharacterized protein n=1 Tax=Dioscorea alata TaxID=55571 RepID=A0ACB7WG35_DIOAL|nr:hypothetical protein IHE45_04G125800 [Dioscorea alata]
MEIGDFGGVKLGDRRRELAGGMVWLVAGAGPH